MRNRILACGLLGALCGPALVAAEEAPPTVALQRLTLATATKVAQAALAACRAKGIQVGVTVVDRDGLVQVVLRDTIAAQITLPISRLKAYTAVNFNAPTSQLTDRVDTAIGRVPDLLMHPGGLPIQAAGQLLGGVGVSGSPAGETDEECAQAGVDAVSDDLEMAL